MQYPKQKKRLYSVRRLKMKQFAVVVANGKGRFHPHLLVLAAIFIILTFQCSRMLMHHGSQRVIKHMSPKPRCVQ